MSFAKKRSSYSTEKVKIVSVTASFGKKAKCFQPSVVICKINGKGNQQFLAGFAGKTLLSVKRCMWLSACKKTNCLYNFR